MSAAKVGIIHYGLGNLRSVYNSLEYIGAAPFIAKTPNDLKQADYAILPGVGAFGDGMKNLEEHGWVEVIHKFALKNEKPFLGICLGMQLLASKGTEHGEHKGLDLIKGTVIKMTPPDKSIRIPHIGWNSIEIKPDTKMFADAKAPHDFYFVHSYVLEPEDTSSVSATCEHGQTFVACIEQNNVWGAQFHPEKSQRSGLALLSNFVKA